jgi:transposase
MHFVGLDWASRTHAVCIIDDRGAVLAHFEVEHTDLGVDELLERLKKLKEPRLAIERPEGVLVDRLVDAGIHVVAVHPNIVKAARSRYRTAGKSDAGDAYVLADLLRTDGHRFNALVPHAAEIQALRLLVRLRKDFVQTRVGLGNQLRATLDAFYPGAVGVFSDLTSPISLAFLRAFPSEAHARKLTEEQLQQFLREHKYSGRRSAADLLRRLNAAPRTALSGDVAETAAVAVLSHVATLEPLVAQIKSLKDKIKARLCELADAKIVQSFPGSGGVNAAMIPREAWERSRTLSNPRALRRARRRYAGYLRVGKASCGGLPVGLRSRTARGPDVSCRQLAKALRLGCRHVPACTRAGLRSPACGAHPGSRLGPRHLEMLAGKHSLRTR